MNKQNNKLPVYLTQPMKAYIYHVDLYENLYYPGASIEFPATSDFIQDALDKARIYPGDGYKFTELMWNQHCFEGDILKGATIEEVNFLAWRLAQMDEHYGLLYEACLKMKGNDLTLKDMINLTYALDNCHVGYHINNDEELGRFAAEGNFIEELVNIADEVWEFINFKKVGERMRKAEKGLFIRGCYVTCDIENIDEIYDGITLPQNTLADVGMFNLLISKAPMDDEPIEDQAKWLYLPASAEQLTDFLNELGAKSFNECVYYKFSTAVPKIKDLFYDLSQLEQLNALAECISKQEFCKCKAVLEYMDCESIAQAMDYCENLHCFDYYPKFFHPSDYGKYIFRMTGSALANISKYVSFEPYGKEQMHLHNTKSTPYGFVSQNGNKMTFKHSEVHNRELNDFEM